MKRLLIAATLKKSIEMQTCIAHALVCIGEILMLQNERTAALSIFEEVVERFSASDVSQLQIQVSHALACKVLILVESNDTTSSMRDSLVLKLRSISLIIQDILVKCICR